MIFTKTLYKSEVAEMLNISIETLSRWLNKRYFEELKELGYYKRQKKLNPKQLNYLVDKIALTPD